MKHLYRVVRCPKGAAPAYLPWHHLWLALGLTALGLLLGWLTMPLAAVSSPDLSAQDLWVWYMSSVDLWYRNLLPPVLLIWLLVTTRKRPKSGKHEKTTRGDPHETNS